MLMRTYLYETSRYGEMESNAISIDGPNLPSSKFGAKRQSIMIKLDSHSLNTPSLVRAGSLETFHSVAVVSRQAISSVTILTTRGFLVVRTELLLFLNIIAFVSFIVDSKFLFRSIEISDIIMMLF
jgi:hypothetical protein